MVDDKATLHIYLLGDLRIVRGSEPVSSISSARAQSLFAYLVLHAGVPQSRRHLAFLLWPDSSDEQSLSNLRKLLHDLRRALPDVDRYIESEGPNLVWCVDASYTLDVAELEQTLDKATTVAQLQRAVDLYRGPLFQSCYDDWVLPERERLHQLVVDTLGRLVEQLENAGEYRKAIQYGQVLLQQDPLHEDVYRALMRLYALTEDRAAALRTFQTCAGVLKKELGVEPSLATKQAYERLLNLKGAAVPAVRGATPMVGHQREWVRLQGVWRQVTKGQSHWVVLTGAAGIGKTRLAEELLGWAAKQGIATASAQCYAAESGLGYGPVTTWLRERGLPELEGVWLTELARVLPEVLAKHPELRAPGPLNEAWQRVRFFEALVRALVGREPLILVLDDLQYCDADTLEWLHYLLRYKGPASLLVVSTVCLEEVGPESGLARLLEMLRRRGQVTEIGVQGLSKGETAELAAQVEGHAVEGEVTERLYAETEGSPLFILEMVRAGRFGEEAGRLPRTMASVIGARLGQLSGETRGLVNVAAVIGREFTVKMLGEASGVREEALVRGLGEMRQKRIVKAPEGERYEFDHSQLREVAYGGMNPAERAMWHRKVAEALLRAEGERPNGASGEIVAHLEAAGLWERAVPYQVHAGDVARKRYANETAIQYYRRALPYLSEPERTDVTLKLGRVLEFTGKSDEAESLYRQTLGTAEYASNAPLRAKCELTLGTLLHRKGSDTEALCWLECAREGFELAGDAEGVGNVLENIGLVYDLQGNYPRALEAHQQHLAIASKQENRREMSQAIGNIGLVNWRQGNYARALQFYDRQYELACESDDRLGMSRALGRKGLALLEQGDTVRALDHFQQRLEIANAIGDVLGASYAIGDIGLVYFSQGDYARALSQFAQQLKGAQEFGALRGVSQGIRCIGILYAEQGDTVRAQECYVTSLQIALRVGDRRMVANAVSNLADAYAASGQPIQAERLYAQALALLRALNLPFLLAETLYRDAQFYYCQFNHNRAQSLVTEALRIADEIDRKDIRFQAKILAILNRAGAAPLTRTVGIKKLQALLPEALDEQDTAYLHYALARLDPEDKSWGKTGARLYRKLHARTPRYVYRMRYQELSGTRLPEPQPLPEPPLVEIEHTLQREELLGQVNEMIEHLKPLKPRPLHSP